MKRADIIGAGLVGSLWACFLAKRKYEVHVYERRSDMRTAGYIGGRSINLALSVRGWTALEKIGLKSEIEKIAIPMNGRMVHNIDGTQSFHLYGKESEAIYSVSRAELNLRLLELADTQENVTFHFDEQLEKVDFKNTTSTFKNTKTSTVSNSAADVVFGADGAFSATRLSMMLQHNQFNYSQTYIEHGYKELSILPNADGSFQLDKNALHIWPRETFMLIALPNIDGSFTCTLFHHMDGEEGLQNLNSKEKIAAFLQKYFPDFIALAPHAVDEFLENPTSTLTTIRCAPWKMGNVCLIGDAAHGIVPFFGQGMNAGFEDCRILDELADAHQENWEAILSYFSATRKKDTDAIAQMALDNFIEMRDLVDDAHFLRKKQVERALMQIPSLNYTSMYSAVSFSNEPYSQAFSRGKIQNELLEALVKIDEVEHKLETPEVREIIRQYLS